MYSKFDPCFCQLRATLGKSYRDIRFASDVFFWRIFDDIETLPLAGAVLVNLIGWGHHVTSRKVMQHELEDNDICKTNTATEY